jgi:hypothetical protein
VIDSVWLGVVACFAVVGWIVAIAQSLMRRDEKKHRIEPLTEIVVPHPEVGERVYVVTHVVSHNDVHLGETLQIYAEPKPMFWLRRTVVR